jgi:hypothetical protein
MVWEAYTPRNCKYNHFNKNGLFGMDKVLWGAAIVLASDEVIAADSLNCFVRKLLLCCVRVVWY